MATIESIGTGGTYATPQAWYDARKGDITTGTKALGAPYIGEMMPGVFTGGLDMSASTTDVSHYFHLRAKAGVEFSGVFSGNYPMITKSSGTEIIKIEDDYTRIEHICVGNTSGRASGIYANAVTGLILDSCGVYNMRFLNGNIEGGIHIEGLTVGQTVVIRNCCVGLMYVYGGGAQYATGIRVESAVNQGVVELYNNTVNQIVSEAVTPTVRGIVVTDVAAAKVINNVIGVIEAEYGTVINMANTAGTLVSLNNAAESDDGTLGTLPITHWVSENVFIDTSSTTTMDLHLVDGQPGLPGTAGANPLRQAGLNLKKSSLYINAPTYDIDNQVRGSHVSWNIGADGDPEGSTKGTTQDGMTCRTPAGLYTTVRWRLFYPQCPKVNTMCNPVAGGYVAASTVCQQQLW
jgi:hypothetical protein